MTKHSANSITFSITSNLDEALTDEFFLFLFL